MYNMYKMIEIDGIESIHIPQLALISKDKHLEFIQLVEIEMGADYMVETDCMKELVSCRYERKCLIPISIDGKTIAYKKEESLRNLGQV